MRLLLLVNLLIKKNLSQDIADTKIDELKKNESYKEIPQQLMDVFYLSQKGRNCLSLKPSDWHCSVGLCTSHMQLYNWACNTSLSKYAIAHSISFVSPRAQCCSAWPLQHNEL